VVAVVAIAIEALRRDTFDIEVLGNLTKQGLGVPQVGHGYMAGDRMSLDRRAAISIIKPAPPVMAKSRLAAKSRHKRYRVQVGELIGLRPDTIPELQPDAAWQPSRPDVAVRVLEQDCTRGVVVLDGPAGAVNLALVTSTQRQAANGLQLEVRNRRDDHSPAGRLDPKKRTAPELRRRVSQLMEGPRRPFLTLWALRTYFHPQMNDGSIESLLDRTELVPIDPGADARLVWLISNGLPKPTTLEVTDTAWAGAPLTLRQLDVRSDGQLQAMLPMPGHPVQVDSGDWRAELLSAQTLHGPLMVNKGTLSFSRHTFSSDAQQRVESLLQCWDWACVGDAEGTWWVGRLLTYSSAQPIALRFIQGNTRVRVGERCWRIGLTDGQQAFLFFTDDGLEIGLLISAHPVCHQSVVV
jgi:hypothetical protein